MGHHYISSAATCPFYREESPNTIFCEGLDGDEDSALRVFFRRGERAKEHKYDFCHGCWPGCPVAQMLWQGSGINSEPLFCYAGDAQTGGGAP